MALDLANSEIAEKRQKWLEKKRLWGRKWYVNNKGKVYEANGKWAFKYRKQLKYKVIKGYGGKCSCCGESEWGFLTIDHIQRNGRVDRAKYRGKTGGLYKWLLDNRFPKENYRLLCMNCNWGQRHTGICPHHTNYQHIEPIELRVA